jgi:hypothetical protein
MDGLMLIRETLDYLDQETASTLKNSDQRVLYKELDKAAVEFVRQTHCLKSSTFTITTVEDHQEYALPPDFLNLYMKNGRGRFFIKFYDGSSYSYPVKIEHEDIFWDNDQDSREIPDCFAVIDAQELPARINGAADAAGSRVAGECTLQDDSMLFTTTNLVYPRDVIHNTTDRSDGLIVSVTDATHLSTVLFNGKKNSWSQNDAFVIRREPVKKLVFSAPCSTAGYTVTIPYVCKPAPVYSDYAAWMIPEESHSAICAEAAFQYENRKDDFTSADRHHAMFLAEVKRYNIEAARLILQGRRSKYRP